MPLETATTIAGLNALWPLGSDSKGQGDDHLRLIKSVLQTDPAVSAGLVAQPRSRVVNGAMQITQEIAKNTSTPVASGVYIADQWFISHASAASPTTVVQQIAPLIPDSSWRIRVSSGATPDTSIAAGDVCRIYQYIEGIRIADFAWGTANARQVVLRFTARSSKTGTFCVALRNSASDRSYIRNCTIAAADTDQEFTLVIPGDVTGTWTTDTGYGVLLYFTLTSGTNTGAEGWQAGNFQATSAISNFLGTANATFDLTRVGLYLDPAATGRAPAWVMPDEADELRACQRYWEDIGTYGFYWSGNTTTSSTYYAVGYWKVRKRAVPALTASPATASGFPNTVGTLVGAIDTGRESRVSNGTLSGGYFYSNALVANARM